MYECENCGADGCSFPGVFLAVNTQDKVYPYHRSKFELKLEELYRDEGKSHYTSEAWKDFWSWLGDNEIKWLCSTKCAVAYLEKHPMIQM